MFKSKPTYMLATVLIYAFTFVCCNAQDSKKLTINGDSEASLEKSVQTLKSSLNEEDGEKFLMSIMIIEYYLDNQYETDEELQKELLKMLHGKNYDQVILLGQQCNEKNKERQKADAKAEIDALYKKLEDANKQKAALNKITVKNLKITKVTEFNKDRPLVEFSFVNNTEVNIQQVYFLIYDPSNSTNEQNIKIWHNSNTEIKVSQEITYSRSEIYKGNLEQLLANQSDLKIKATDILDSNRNKIFSDSYFTDFDKRKLDNLLKKYPDLKRN